MWVTHPKMLIFVLYRTEVESEFVMRSEGNVARLPTMSNFDPHERSTGRTYSMKIKIKKNGLVAYGDGLKEPMGERKELLQFEFKDNFLLFRWGTTGGITSAIGKIRKINWDTRSYAGKGTMLFYKDLRNAGIVPNKEKGEKTNEYFTKETHTRLEFSENDGSLIVEEVGDKYGGISCCKNQLIIGLDMSKCTPISQKKHGKILTEEEEDFEIEERKKKQGYVPPETNLLEKFGTDEDLEDEDEDPTRKRWVKKYGIWGSEVKAYDKTLKSIPSKFALGLDGVNPEYVEYEADPWGWKINKYEGFLAEEMERKKEFDRQYGKYFEGKEDRNST